MYSKNKEDDTVNMNTEQLNHFTSFFEDVFAHLDQGILTTKPAIDALQAIAFNAIKTIEHIKREE